MDFCQELETSETMARKNVDSSFDNEGFNSDRILLFDLSVRGHHPSYIQHLVKYWGEKELPGRLDIVVSPRFIQEHADVVSLAEKYEPGRVNFVAITTEEAAALKARTNGISRALRDFQEWHLLRKYAASLGASQCLIMYFDTCRLPLTFGARLSCPFSGIYFRPTFHYHEFANYVSSWKARVQRWREKIDLSRVLSHPQLKTLFCLDPFAVKHLDQIQNRVRAVHLPDPVESSNVELPTEELREKLGIHPDRKIFLLFGALTERKGVPQLLDAILELSPTLCEQLCLLLVGESKIKAQLEDKIAICQSRNVQIIRRYEFVPDQDVQAYFQLTNVVLAPYQQHVGMSGILLLAAAAQKPVLSSNYGLMGEVVERYGLGLTVDSTVPSEIAKGLTRFLVQSPQELCDRHKMKSFAEQNSTEQFAKVIFQHLQ